VGIGVSEERASKAPTQDSTDILLWLGGLIVAGVGVSWLLLAQPWASGPSSTASAPIPATQPWEPERLPRMDNAQVKLDATLDDPLRMARIALEAGMLVEPEDYSAWSLYERVLENEPENRGASAGLAMVADALVQRGAVALEQGRFDDVRAIVDHILATLPAHAAASGLATDLGGLLRTDVPSGSPEPLLNSDPVTERSAPSPVAAARTRPQAVQTQVALALPEVNPLAQIRSAFDDAITADRLLTPTGDSARHFIELMLAMDGEAEMAREARGILSRKLLQRAVNAIDRLDAQAAETWIDEAAALTLDAEAVKDARASLTARLIQAESSKLVPASQLTMEEYVPPRYPNLALARHIEGWVDVEFVIAVDGTVRDVVVTDASHEELFRDEAVTAIERWRIVPRVFMDQSIEQRTYTRVSFRLQ